jgi:hypothetical protein
MSEIQPSAGAESAPLDRERKRALRGALFRHLDGIVTAPTAHSLAKAGVLEVLFHSEVASLADLTERFDANEGYLNVALRTLASQGWLEQDLDPSGADVRFNITDAGRAAIPYLPLYEDVVQLSRYSAEFHPRKFEIEPFRRMEAVFERHRSGYGLDPARDETDSRVRTQVLTHIEGALLGPTIVRLGMSGMFHKYFMEASFRPDEFHEDGEHFGRLLAMFESLGWFTRRNETFRFTETGLFFARRASAYGVTVSYLPTLRNLDELIFGDPDVLRVDPGATERHVDRETNVWGSGGAHSAYFRAIDSVIVELFNRPIADQPRGIVDMGCGNGAFLEHLFDLVEHHTLRGELLEDHPLFLVGVDFNETALRVTRANLTRADIWAKVIQGDVGRPDRLAHDLMSDYGIDLRDLLNVRTFLDHNRRWEAPDSAADARESSSTGAFAHRGARIRNGEVEASLREHLGRWAPFVERFGLLVIELHTIAPELAAANLGRTAATAYDATHGYSDQYIVEADVFRRVAEEAGLVATEADSGRFPDSELASVTINLLKPAR